MRLQFAINVFLRSRTAGWCVVTKGNSLSLPFLLLFLFKTEFIVVGTWQQLAKMNIANICVGGDGNITPVASVKNLGSWFDHMTPTSIRLHWFAACFRTEYKILILRFKAIYGVARSYICNLIKIKGRTRHNLRSIASKELYSHHWLTPGKLLKIKHFKKQSLDCGILYRLE